MKPKSVFIGIGKMGLPMARHLHNSGYPIEVFDLDPSRLELARKAGLIMTTQPSHSIAQANTVFSSLPGDGALLSVAAEISAHASQSCTWVDTSTVSLEASRQAAAICQQAGVEYLRVTVSGNNHMAEAAQLTIMASGSRQTYQSQLPALGCWGANLFYLGEGEQSRLMKLVINLMIAQTSAMLSEALNLGQVGGLQWKDMWQVITASAVASPIVKAKSQQLSNFDYSPTFTTHQMLKDIGLMMDAGAQLNVPLPQLGMTQQLMRAAVAQGDGELDYASIIRVMQRATGVKPQP